MIIRRTSRALLSAAALLLSSGPAFCAQAPVTLAWLLRQHDRAATVPGAHAMDTQETIYALEASGLTGTLTEYDAPPHKVRVEMTLGPIRQTTGDDGRTSWQQDMSGHVRVLSGPELAESRASQSFTLENYDPVRDGARGRISLRPEREAGTGDYVLDLAPVGGSRQTVYLDPRTYLTRKMVATEGGITGVIQILAYTQVRGEQVPAQLLVSYAGLPITVSAHLVSATRGVPLAPTLFALPSRTTPDFAFLTADGQGPATVPFTDDHGEIVLAVTVNGTPLHLILDSGAGSSFLTAQAAQGLDLPLSGSVPAIGYGGAAHTGVATHATLALPGAVRLPNQTLYVLRDPSVAAALSQHGALDGALGYDLFARFVVTVDYTNKTLTLTAPSAYTPPDGATVLPLRLDTRTPSVAASVDGRPAARFIVDTGDNAVIHLYRRYAVASGLMPHTDGPNTQVLTGIGVGGTIREVVTPDHTLRLGGQTLTGLPVAFLGDGGITDVLHQAGGLGYGVLSHFVVTFDYPHQRLVLQAPGEDPTQPPLRAGEGPERSRPSCPSPFPKGEAGRGSLWTEGVPLGLLVSGQARADTPLTTAEVLRRHLAALGGRDAVAAITSTRVTADVLTGGLTGTVTTVYQAPEDEFEEDKIGILDIVQGYDGKTAWRRDTNGNLRLLGPDEVQNLRNQLYFDTNSYVLPGPIQGTITLRPQRDPGTGDYVLDALPEGGKPTTIFLSHRTFLIDREQHQDDDVTVITTYGDYRLVNGVQFPFAQHTTNGNKRYDISLTVRALENNVATPETLFQEPTGDNKADFVTPGATSATVPFDFNDGEIGLTVAINGHPGRVFLDSGSSGIAISKATADALHLPQSGYLEARGYGGSTDLLPVKVASFEVPGAIRLTDVAAVAIPLSQALSSFLADPVSGFVGYDLFSHFVIRVDFPKRRITFIAPDSFQPTASDGQPVPIALDDDIPTLTAQLDALPSARYLVDSGDSGQLRLYGPYVAKCHLNQKYPGGVATVGGGVGGASLSRLTRVGSFTVAGVTLHDIPTDFSLDTKGGASQIEAGSIGVALLSRFVVTFDYPHGRIFFAPGPGAALPFNTRTSGLSVGMGGLPQHVIITAVAPGAPAQFTGIKAGDALISIDGASANGLGLTAVQGLLSGGDGKPQHTLMIQSGQDTPRTVVVSLYDPLAPRPPLP